MITLTATLSPSRNNSTTLLGTHFEKANAIFVAEQIEHNSVSAIVFFIQKAAFEVNKTSIFVT